MNLLELFVEVGFNDKASGAISSFTEKIGNGIKTAAAIGTAAVSAASAGIAALTKAAVDNYAEYEQLVGGVETLFKDSADKIIKYAENAYTSAGVSTNEYMATVTSFAASLVKSAGLGIQQDLEDLEDELDAQIKAQKRANEDAYNELKQYYADKIKLAKENKDGTADLLRQERDEQLLILKRANEDKIAEMEDANERTLALAEEQNNTSIITAETYGIAADLANQAIIDMSDNANKMGSMMESIQFAYQGFAKQNYTIDLMSAAKP